MFEHRLVVLHRERFPAFPGTDSCVSCPLLRGVKYASPLMPPAPLPAVERRSWKREPSDIADFSAAVDAFHAQAEYPTCALLAIFILMSTASVHALQSSSSTVVRYSRSRSIKLPPESARLVIRQRGP